MQTIVITGGSGLIGRALSRALAEKGYRVIILSRKPADQPLSGNISYAIWDVENQSIDKEAIRAADYIIHLAGAGVAERRWTKKRKQEIISSRVESSRLIADSLKTIPNNVKAVVSASAIGWYGADRFTPNPRPAVSSGQASPQDAEGKSSRKFEESDPPADDFLGTTCKQWEESIAPVTSLGKRLVILRTGIVLSTEGGALKEFIKPMKFGIASILGNGNQIISWIHIDDLLNMFISAIENEKMTGVFNAVAPHPVSNKELIIELARARKRFFIPVHVPSFLLKLGLGEMSAEILKSASVSSQKVLDAGFVFQFQDITSAITDLIKNNDLRLK